MFASMRLAAALAFAVLSIPLIAAAPDAPVHKAKTTIPQSAPAGLRGAAPIRGAQLPAPAPLAALPPAIATTATASTAETDPGQCRAACARPYYFCLAGGAPESCPEAWSRCVSGCDGP
ncbi:MAG TPA: hypothetical protein VKU90_16510 [Caulobacteraceae bacterium]|jgi:hypothetical protein|nr:hypothetical protein [Caulobacteraceae bacterium]